MWVWACVYLRHATAYIAREIERERNVGSDQKDLKAMVRVANLAAGIKTWVDGASRPRFAEGSEGEEKRSLD